MFAIFFFPFTFQFFRAFAVFKAPSLCFVRAPHANISFSFLFVSDHATPTAQRVHAVKAVDEKKMEKKYEKESESERTVEKI